MSFLPHLVLFDCDGTLTDSQAAIILAMQRAFAEQGLAEPDAASVRRIIGLSLAKAVQALAPEGTDVAALQQAYRDHYVAQEASLTLYPNVHETLQVLRERGYWMAVVTGKSRHGLLRVMEQFDLAPYFLTWRTADCCPSKPHPAMAEECMQELGVQPEQTLLVGDACFDMQMAQAAGVDAIGVSYGVETADNLLATGALWVADDISQLLSHLPQLAK